jgi:hypothetical protein
MHKPYSILGYALWNRCHNSKDLSFTTVFHGIWWHSPGGQCSLLTFPPSPNSTRVDTAAVLLAHLILPALTISWVNAKVYSSGSEKLDHLIQCVAQNAHGLQDTEALQSLFIWGSNRRAAFVAWTMPRQDFDGGFRSTIDLRDRVHPARLEFSILTEFLSFGKDIIQRYNALLAALPLNSITSLTVKGSTPLRKEDWRSHTSGWHKLERVRLFRDAVPTFRGMLEDTAVLGDPLLPSLEEIALVDITLNAPKVHYLCDMFMECVELGIPLRMLDIRTCRVANGVVKLFSEIVSCEEGIGRSQREKRKRRRSWRQRRKRLGFK